MHLRTISTNTPHKAAARAELETPVPLQVGQCFIQIVNDVIGMFFWLHGPGLIVWDWRKGETLVVCLPREDRLPFAALPEQPAITSELYPGTWDFAFLSSRAYILTTIGGRGSIEIYGINGNKDNAGQTIHAASLLFPETRDNIEMHHLTTHSSPFLGGDITEDRPFAASEENRVHLMSFHYGRDFPRYHLAVKNDFLLSFVEKYDGQRRILRWEDWGPDNTRVLEARNSDHFHWLRCVILQ